MSFLRSLVSPVALSAILAAACASGASAQSGAARPTDSVFARARQLVVNGNGAAGRVLVDSMVAASEPDTPAYAEALFWRASLAASSDDAERDYRRIVVEYPLSPHAAEALFKLAQLESTRGDRASAEAHLDRLLSEYPSYPERSQAGVLLVRMAFQANDYAHGCPVLQETIRSIPESNVELRNQLEYYVPRCASFEAQRAASVAAAAESTAHANAARDSAAKAAKARYSLQVASYNSKSGADALAKKLVARGYEARVVGTEKPYRVRIGRFATRTEAAAEQKRLKAKKIDVEIVDLGSNDR